MQQFRLQVWDTGPVEASGTYNLLTVGECDTALLFDMGDGRFLFSFAGLWTVAPELCDRSSAEVQRELLADILEWAQEEGSRHLLGGGGGSDPDGKDANLTCASDDAAAGTCAGRPSISRAGTTGASEADISRAKDLYQHLDPQNCTTNRIYGAATGMYTFQLNGIWTVAPAPCDDSASLLTTSGAEIGSESWRDESDAFVNVTISGIVYAENTPPPAPAPPNGTPPLPPPDGTPPPPPLNGTPPPPGDAPEDGGGSNTPVGLIVGASVAGFVVICAVGIGAFLFVRRRAIRRVRPSNESEAEGLDTSED
uniref:Uncharacterized protein n=1 Tax=Tetraselmis sp. GSL018 TaxID=582737 RepID=A0A061RUN7_9CHLO